MGCRKCQAGDVELPVKFLDSRAWVPTRAHARDAGLDLYAIERAEILPGQDHTLRTGIAVAIPEGHFGLVALRSSVAKRGLSLQNGLGVIDAGYRGEILIAASCRRPKLGGIVEVEEGDRIAQLLVLPILETKVSIVNDLPDSERGEGGFGSSGR